MNIQKLRKGIIYFSIVLAVAIVIYFDYSDFSWANNSGNYIGLITVTCIVISGLLSIRYERKLEKSNSPGNELIE